MIGPSGDCRSRTLDQQTKGRNYAGQDYQEKEIKARTAGLAQLDLNFGTVFAFDGRN